MNLKGTEGGEEPGAAWFSGTGLLALAVALIVLNYSYVHWRDTPSRIEVLTNKAGSAASPEMIAASSSAHHRRSNAALAEAGVGAAVLLLSVELFRRQAGSGGA